LFNFVVVFPLKLCDVLNKAFPTPEYLTLNPSGVDISSEAVYFMKMKKTKDGVVPDKFEKIPFGKNIEINENLTNINNLNTFYYKYFKL
jgi:hypothetical protein